MSSRALAAIALASFTAALSFAAPTLAEEVTCQPNIIGKTVDNVRVSGTCIIRRSLVKGNIVLSSGSKLIVDGSTIRGSVQGEGATMVRLLPNPYTGRETRVVGDVQLHNMKRSTLWSIITANVGGTIILDSNQARINLYGNDVGGDIQVFQNRRAPVRIRDNTIDGNLQCKSNWPRPINLGGNTVGGNAEDQCANFAQ